MERQTILIRMIASIPLLIRILPSPPFFLNYFFFLVGWCKEICTALWSTICHTDVIRSSLYHSSIAAWS